MRSADSMMSRRFLSAESLLRLLEDAILTALPGNPVESIEQLRGLGYNDHDIFVKNRIPLISLGVKDFLGCRAGPSKEGTFGMAGPDGPPVEIFPGPMKKVLT